VLISVVVAVKNERPHIRKCIEALSRQNYAPYEVIVVDGMSTDGTYELLEELQETHDFRLLRNPLENAAAGRNRGIETARGDIVAFVDGDAVPYDDWLSQISRLFVEHDVAGVGGPDLLPGDSIYKSKAIGRVMTSPLARGGQLNPSTQHTMEKGTSYVDHIPTCNLALRRSVVEEVGMFDEAFVKGQDLELNHRIRRAGHRLLYSSRVRVVHYRKQHIRHFARQIYKWAKAKVAIVKKHGLQGMLSHVYLWPAYGLTGLLGALALFWFLGILDWLVVLLFLGGVAYAMAIALESVRLAHGYHDIRLFLYALLLLPGVHVSYAYGVLYALLRRRIW
jgi:glycosyltransferase involved in cell wall biosynthesis